MDSKSLIAEKRAAGRIIDRALTQGYVISVNDGEDWVVRQSKVRKRIIAALASTDSDTLLIRDRDGKRIGVIQLIWGNSPDEVAADYTDTPVIAALVEAA